MDTESINLNAELEERRGGSTEAALRAMMFEL